MSLSEGEFTGNWAFKISLHLYAIGEKIRLRFVIPFMILVQILSAQLDVATVPRVLVLVLLSLPGGCLLGTSLCVWSHRRMKGYAHRRLAYAGDMAESARLFREQKTPLGAMRSAVGKTRVVDNLEAEEKRLRKKWRVKK